MLDSWAPTEQEKIEAWRLHVLIQAGYPVVLAEQLAGRGDVDLHRATDLPQSGCTFALAAEILL